MYKIACHHHILPVSWHFYLQRSALHFSGPVPLSFLNHCLLTDHQHLLTLLINSKLPKCSIQVNPIHYSRCVSSQSSPVFLPLLRLPVGSQLYHHAFSFSYMECLTSSCRSGPCQAPDVQPEQGRLLKRRMLGYWWWRRLGGPHLPGLKTTNAQGAVYIVISRARSC